MAALRAAIKNYIYAYNQKTHVFEWTPPVGYILTKTGKCKEVSDALRWLGRSFRALMEAILWR
jgi:hypothetical protein